MAGTNFNRLTTNTETSEASEESTIEQSKVSSSSKDKEENKENAFDEESLKNNYKTSTPDKPSNVDKNQEEVCVPDSSNAENEEEQNISDDCHEEQHSSGSVDEELLEDDESMENKNTEEEGERIDQNKTVSPSPQKSSSPSLKNSLVGELMNKFGFSDILEYQEAYRKAVQESKDANKDIVDRDNNNDQSSKGHNGLKLRSDITLDPEQNFTKAEIFKNLETLKRLRPELNGSGTDRETLFAGNFYIFQHENLLYKIQFHLMAPLVLVCEGDSIITRVYLYLLVSHSVN